MKGSSGLFNVLLYCTLFGLIWRGGPVEQKESGPRCMVIAAERVKVGGKGRNGEFLMKPWKKVNREAAGEDGGLGP